MNKEEKNMQNKEQDKYNNKAEQAEKKQQEESEEMNQEEQAAPEESTKEEKQKEQQEETEDKKKSKGKKKTDKEKGKKSKKEEEKKKEKTDTEKLAELQDKYLRLTAEYDNYRRRTLKEKMELSKTAGEEILQSLLPVMDDFERALQSIDESQDIDSVKEGVHLIYNKFKDVLEQKGVKEIEAKDEDFDTDRHEAVSKIPAPNEDMKGKVVDVIQKGYYLNDKILRYSKVVIGE